MALSPATQSALLGCVEIPVFLSQGVTRFENSRHAALRSLIIPVIITPIAAAMVLAAPENEGHSYLWATTNIALCWMFTTILFLNFLYFMMGILKDRTEFWRFVTLYNWLSLTGFVLQAPFLLLGGLGWMSWPSIQHYLALQLLFSYAYEAFALIKTFRIHWALGICLAFADMMCGNIVINLVGDLMN